MRQPIKPFVVQRKRKWQPKREPRPLFTQEELLRAQVHEVAASVPAVPPVVHVVADGAVPEASAPLPRILPDLTVTRQGSEPKMRQDAREHRKKRTRPIERQSGSDRVAGGGAAAENPFAIEPQPAAEVLSVARERTERSKSRAKQIKHWAMIKRNSLSKLSLDELVELRNEVSGLIEIKIGQERAELQAQLEALGAYGAERRKADIRISPAPTSGRGQALKGRNIDSLRSVGVSDLRGLAEALNHRGVRTARGGRWHVSNVRNVIARQRFLRGKWSRECTVP